MKNKEHCEAIEFKNVCEFLEKCESFLLARESENNFILGLSDAILNKTREVSDPLFFGIFKEGQIVGASIRIDVSRPLSVTRMDERYLELLCLLLVKEKIELSGVVGENKAAECFSKFYSRKTNTKSIAAMSQGIYELRKVKIPKLNGRKLVLATQNEFDIIQKFLEGFITDCFPDDKNSLININGMAKRHIQNKTLYLLQNNLGQYVSMAANNRNTKNSACISLVYTPIEFRGNGHGSLVTALVSQKMLDSGKELCNLLTDLDNPTSNSIYQNIGYKRVGSCKHFEFK